MTKAGEFLSGVLGLLAPIGAVKSKPMFGRFGIFLDECMFALITKNDELFLKADDVNRPDFEGLGLQPYGRMPYYAAPVDSLCLWEDIRPWVEGAAAAAFRAKGAKGKTARG
jgi:DNA transformation protein